jgi:hypothetical protein
VNSRGAVQIGEATASLAAPWNAGVAVSPDIRGEMRIARLEIE